MKGILQNERFGALAIDGSGVITGFNHHAFDLLSETCGLKTGDDLIGRKLNELSGLTEEFDSREPEKALLGFDGVRFVETVFLDGTDTSVVRFVNGSNLFIPFMEILNLSSLPYVELDHDLKIVFASESFVHKTGMHKSDLYGSSISLFAYEPGAEKIRSAWKLFNKNIVQKMIIQKTAFSFGGESGDYNLLISAICERDTSPSGLLCCLADTDYEEIVSDLNRNVRKMSAVANFSGAVIHDFNNAMTAVLGNISLAKMEAGDNSELDELLRDAESAGLKIKKLTERLAQYSRGIKQLKVRSDIKELIENSKDSLFSGFGGRISLKLADDIASPEISPVQLKEALGYVVENAIDATAGIDDPFIEIELKETDVMEEGVLHEASLVSGRYIVISVRDNGNGMESEDMYEIFDPYITTKHGRDGLGLATAFAIMKRHRGFITAYNLEDGGACFEIYIPLF